MPEFSVVYPPESAGDQVLAEGMESVFEYAQVLPRLLSVTSTYLEFGVEDRPECVECAVGLVTVMLSRSTDDWVALVEVWACPECGSDGKGGGSQW